MTGRASKESIAIIADAGAGIPTEVMEDLGIGFIPLWMSGNDQVLEVPARALGEEETRKFEDYLRSGAKVTTSAPSPGDVSAAIGRAIEQGYSSAIIVSISSALSSTFSTACMVAGELAEEDGFPVDVIDTRGIGASVGLVALEASALVADGIDPARIGQLVARAATWTRVWFSVRDLIWLRNGGRIGEATYRIGSLLGVKPVITCDDAGKYVVAKKARGWERSIECQLGLAMAHARGFSRVKAAICTTTSERETGDKLEEHLRDCLGQEGIELLDMRRWPFPTPLLVHTGPDAVGIAIQGVSL